MEATDFSPWGFTWLFPHLSLDDAELAREAARQVFQLAKPEALIAIGPFDSELNLIRNTLLRRPARGGLFTRGQDEDRFVDQVVGATQLTGDRRLRVKTIDEVGTPYMGTTRFTTMRDGKMLLYDPIDGVYVSPVSKRGMYHGGKLAVAGLRHLHTLRKEEKRKARGDRR